MKTRLVTQAILVLLIASCSQPTPTADPAYRETAFATTLPFSEWNSSLQLELAPVGLGNTKQDLKANELITLTAKNMGPYTILLPEDFGVRLFTFSNPDKTWIEIENAIEFRFLEAEPIIISPNTSFASATPTPGYVTILARPLLNIDEPVLMRTVVVGQFYDGPHKSEEVRAYIDLLIEP